MKILKYQFEALHTEGQNSFYAMRVQITCFKYSELYRMATGQFANSVLAKSEFACIALGTSIKL
jgi:hypothetical protein